MSSIRRARLKNLDVAALLREVGRNQDEIEKRVAEYAFKQTETDREINSKGELKKETSQGLRNLSTAESRAGAEVDQRERRAAFAGTRGKGRPRVQEEFAKAEREKEKDEKKVAQRRAERERKN